MEADLKCRFSLSQEGFERLIAQAKMRKEPDKALLSAI